MMKQCLGFTFVVFFTLVTSLNAEEKDKRKKASIRGEIKVVKEANEDAKKKGVLGSLRVEGAKEDTTDYDKAVISITKDTKISKVMGKEFMPAKFEDLKKGCKVRANFKGPVAESYPVQATAGDIVILE